MGCCELEVVTSFGDPFREIDQLRNPALPLCKQRIEYEAQGKIAGNALRLAVSIQTQAAIDIGANHACGGGGR